MDGHWSSECQEFVHDSAREEISLDCYRVYEYSIAFAMFITSFSPQSWLVRRLQVQFCSVYFLSRK